MLGARHIIRLLMKLDPLLGDVAGAGFAHDSNGDGAGVSHLVSNALFDIKGEFGEALVVNFLWFDDDADFTAWLDRVGFGHAFVGGGDLFEFREPLGVFLVVFVAGAGAGAGDGVGDIDEHGFGGTEGFVLVVLFDAVDNFLGNVVLFEEVDPKFDVTAFIFDDFTDVVEQTAKPDRINVGADFVGQGDANLGFLESVGDHVLAIRKTVLKPAKHTDKFLGKVVDANGVAELPALLEHNFLDFFFGLLDILFDPGWLDAAVGQEALESYAGNFAAHRVKTTEPDLAGRFVKVEVDTGGIGEGADVSTFFANDPAFTVFAG